MNDKLIQCMIYERGNGFPDVNEMIYNCVDNCIYEVKSIDSGILTKQFIANHIKATIEYKFGADHLSDDEFNSLRILTIS